MLTLTSTPIASAYYQLKVGGDVAVLKGMMKALLAADEAGLAAGERRPARPGVHRRAHRPASRRWSPISPPPPGPTSSGASGLTRAQIEAMAAGLLERGARDPLLRHGRHPAPPRHGERAADRQSAAAARQHRPAGRRHLPAARPHQRAGRPHRRHHRDPDRGVPAAARPGVRLRGAAQARRTTRSRRSAAMARRHGPRLRRPGRQPRRRDVRTRRPASPRSASSTSSVQIITKLNRTALLTAAHSYILPCLGRTELDEQAGGPQSVTVEDSMSMVHASRGGLKPASRAAALGARDRRRPGARDAAGQRHRLGGHGRRLRPHPRQDRGGVPGLRRLQRPHPGARRLPAAGRGLASANGRRPTARRISWSSPASTRMTGSTSTAWS